MSIQNATSNPLFLQQKDTKHILVFTIPILFPSSSSKKRGEKRKEKKKHQEIVQKLSYITTHLSSASLTVAAFGTLSGS